MELFRSNIFTTYPEIIFGINPKFGFQREAPYFYNMSLTVGDNEKIVWENRTHFCSLLGLNPDHVAYQRQIHSDIIRIAGQGGILGESDALITDKKMLGLAISTADCTPVFIYERKKKVIAGIHSGWRGSEKRIVEKTVRKLKNEFECSPHEMICFIGPSISKENYEVGEEVASLFDFHYSVEKKNGKFLLDVKKINFDMLINEGIPAGNIEVSNECSYANPNLHSYRRDKEISGRALGIIALRERNELR